MNESRRHFLKFAGLTAAGLVAASAGGVLASSGGGGAPAKANKETLHATQWAMVIDTRKLNTDEAIAPLAAACHALHNVPNVPTKQNVKWLWSASMEEAFPDFPNKYQSPEVEHRRVMLLCNHCEQPPCVRVCPTQATYKRPDGIVTMDYHRCIGCRYCMAGCPFGARSFNFGEPREYLDLTKLNKEYPTRMRGVVEKCTFCVERLEVGKQPACVEAANGAIAFGDLSNPESPARKALRENYTIRRKPSLGTEPSVYYII